MSNEVLGRTEFLQGTQFLRPHGTPRTVEMPVTKEYKEKGEKIIAHGWCFTCELLLTEQVAMYITDNEKEEDVCIRVCANGPEIHETLDRMIDEGIEKIGAIENV